MLNSNFKDILTALNDAEADYLLIGAYAMAAHGCPRATGDIDLWVRPTQENAVKVWQALARFGAPLSGLTLRDFHTPDIAEALHDNYLPVLWISRGALARGLSRMNRGLAPGG